MDAMFFAFLFSLIACSFCTKHGVTPSFLEGLDPVAQEEYYDILRNANETIRQQKQTIDMWAAKYEVTDQVNEWNHNQTVLQEEISQNITSIITQLDDANSQLQQILSNEDQTKLQERQAIEDFKNQTGPAADVVLALPKLISKGSHKKQRKIEEESNSAE